MPKSIDGIAHTIYNVCHLLASRDNASSGKENMSRKITAKQREMLLSFERDGEAADLCDFDAARKARIDAATAAGGDRLYAQDCQRAEPNRRRGHQGDVERHPAQHWCGARQEEGSHIGACQLNGGSLRSAEFPPPYARRRAAFREPDICPSPVRR
jgi:hypothetical protein